MEEEGTLVVQKHDEFQGGPGYSTTPVWGYCILYVIIKFDY